VFALAQRPRDASDRCSLVEATIEMDTNRRPHPLHTSMTVADVLAHSPRTAEVFLEHGMACVGCAIGPFETLAEVANIYRVPIEQLLAELTAAQPPGDTP